MTQTDLLRIGPDSHIDHIDAVHARIFLEIGSNLLIAQFGCIVEKRTVCQNDKPFLLSCGLFEVFARGIDGLDRRAGCILHVIDPFDTIGWIFRSL